MQHGAAAELLAGTSLFRGLGGELLLAIIGRGETRRFSAGQPLAVAGARVEAALVILEGEAELEDASGLELGRVFGPGAILAPMGMFVETDHSAGMVAKSEVVALGLERGTVAQLMAEQPYLAAHFSHNVTQILASTTEVLREIENALARSTPTSDAPEEASPSIGATMGPVADSSIAFAHDTDNFASDALSRPTPVRSAVFSPI